MDGMAGPQLEATSFMEFRMKRLCKKTSGALGLGDIEGL
jgi:hypothetical protein